MAAKPSKKLTKTVLHKIDSQLNQRKKITVLGQYEVQIDTYFKLSKIQDVAMDYLKIITELKSRKNITDRTIMRSVALISTLAVKEFSDAPIPDLSRIDDLIKVSAQLLDTGILKEIWDAFPSDQLARLEEEINKISAEFGKQIGEAAIAASLQEQDKAANQEPANPQL
ncbi:hypothetical protein [Paenibacillus sp. J2TS4]|uniref:hypothetical protein n=1 Tax=Paenibacillus sp. J2TS4 TaxID=2807194 RepID=UPI001B0BD5AF|nr:hypothetical protein [Paenibacillus sp. J2TS4]GIP32608.1 hypothetical protein J2TS4_18180 [Paenibacillus sp. J2TS4]